MPKVDRHDLEMAFEWVSAGYGNEAYICLDTGKIHWAGDAAVTDVGEDLPDDVDDPDRYLQVPSKRELDLGVQLALEFVRTVLPAEADEVRAIFRRKGAYRKFKDLLDREGVLEQWYAYRDSRETETIEQWALDNGLELAPELPRPATGSTGPGVNHSIVREQPKPDWSALPRDGARNVQFRVLLQSEGILVANLRFERDATIDEHSAPHDIDVICLAGSGFTSIGDASAAIRAGQTVRWPANMDHCLWTEADTMETLMVERHGVEDD